MHDGYRGTATMGVPWLATAFTEHNVMNGLHGRRPGSRLHFATYFSFCQGKVCGRYSRPLRFDSFHNCRAVGCVPMPCAGM